MKKVLPVVLAVIVLLSIASAYAETLPKYERWLNDYDFDSILADLDSGESGFVGRTVFDIRDCADQCKMMMEDFVLEVDEFTGEKRLTHSLLSSFGKDCQVYPFLDESGLNLFVGFPYRSALHYDKIYLNFGEEIISFDRADKENGFDIQFEKLNGKSWEYSLLSGLDLPEESLASVSFREKGSVTKVDYVVSMNEMIALNAANHLYRSMRKILLLAQADDARKKVMP